MKLEELKILAHVECLLVWDRVCERGGSKEKAIEQLFKEGYISKKHYKHSCPFCEYLRYGETRKQCSRCIWPGDKNHATRCDKLWAPYYKWRHSKTKENAKKVFELIYNIEF